MNQSKNDLRRYMALYRICTVEMLIIFLLTPFFGQDSSNSITYYNAWETLISGHFHPLRTPLYPLIVGSLRAVAGSTAGVFAVWLLQSGIFMISVELMRRISSDLIPNSRIAFIVTACYALLPGPLTLNCAILTESLALSGTVALIYFTLQAYRSGSFKPLLWSLAVLLALVALRPALLYLPVAVGCFWIMAMIAGKRRLAAGATALGGVVLIFLLTGLYCRQMKETYGFASPSSVSAVNNYFTLRKAGLISAGPHHPTLSPVLDSIAAALPSPTDDDIWREARIAESAAGTADLIAYENAALKSAPAPVAAYLLRDRMAEFTASDAVYGGSILPPVRVLTKFLSPNVGSSLLLFIIFIIILAVSAVREHRFDPAAWWLAILFVGCNATVLIGAMSEWPRLLIPDYPVLLLIGALTALRATAFNNSKTL